MHVYMYECMSAGVLSQGLPTMFGGRADGVSQMQLDGKPPHRVHIIAYS